MRNEEAAKLMQIANSKDFYVRILTSNPQSSGLISHAWEEDGTYWYTTMLGDDAYKLTDVGLLRVQIFGLIDTDEVLGGRESSQ